MPTEDPTSEDILIEAMKKAEKAFTDHLESEGLDAAYFAIDLKGYLIASDFVSPLKIVSFDNYKCLALAPKVE
jgi:hypothetical protein